MRPSVARLQERFYPERSTRDAVAIFVRHLESLIRPTDTVLDIGAGAGERNSYNIKGRVQAIWGADLDPRVVDNPLLDRGVVADGTTLPFDDNSIELAFSIYVQEHVAEPSTFAGEISRVLKPGGQYLALTPNRLHYVSLIAALTPTSFHQWLNARRGRDEEDTFPTLYRLNTPTAVARYFRAAGFSAVTCEGIEVEPQYLKFNPATYLCGVAYERLVNSLDMLSRFRINLIVQCTK